MIGRIATLGVLLAFTALLREVMELLPRAAGDHGGTVALGFLLLAAFLAGRVAAAAGFPKITGYIVLGLLVGPHVLGLITEAEVAQLKLIDDIAISLIAFSAGGELKLSEIRSRGRSLFTIMGTEMVAVFTVIAGGVLLMHEYIPITTDGSLRQAAIIALVFGSIAIANSPSVAIAVINDTRSRGPVSSTILGVTVLKDVLVILLFAVALAVARTAATPGAGFELAFFGTLAFEIGGSIVAGALSGFIISLFLRRISTHIVIFALAAAFLNTQVANVMHFEVLIMSLTAGFFIENISPVHGEPFVQGLEANSTPVYALFFALAGAGIHVAELRTLGVVALAFVVVRAIAIYGGTWIGARMSGAEMEVRKYAWLGFISQAGVTLGMVVIAARAFPDWGAELQTLFVAMVAIHELFGPILLQAGLKAAGETGGRDAPTARAIGPAADDQAVPATS